MEKKYNQNLSSNKNIKKYLLLWSGQSISKMGSAMTGFALLIWVYEKTGSAMSTSLLAVCAMLPYVLVSFYAGAIVDRYEKKAIMLVSDALAGVCAFLCLMLVRVDGLLVWHIYCIKLVISLMNAFQSPASKVVMGLIVSPEDIERASGFRSMAESVITILTPVLAVWMISTWGLSLVLLVDLFTFVAATITLSMIRVGEKNIKNRGEGYKPRKSVMLEAQQGFEYLKGNKGLFHLIVIMSVINFIAAIAYINLLSPMILARTMHDTRVLGRVNGIIGLGGIVGGLATIFKKKETRNSNLIFIMAGATFLVGDIFLGIAREPIVWYLAGFLSSLPLPLLNAVETKLLYMNIPQHLQGRVFSLRGSLQFIAMPLGFLVGGFLADSILEPLMCQQGKFQEIVGVIVGTGEGAGMALIFVITGVLGVIVSIVGMKDKRIKQLEDAL